MGATEPGRASRLPEDELAVRRVMNDAMRRHATGDGAAFATLYDALAPRLLGYLRRQAGDRAKAEDLVQQTFLQMHRGRGQFAPAADVLPWAFAIARRLLIDSVRRGELERRHAPPPGEPTTDSPQHAELHAEQLASRLNEQLARLPENQRTAFELLRIEGLSHADAAQVLGTTVAAVKLRAHRAYEALRAALGELDGIGDAE